MNLIKGVTKPIKNLYQNFLLSYRQVRRGDRNIFIFIVYGMLYDIFLNLYKPFAVKFLDRMGGGPFEISLLNSLPGVMAVFALIPGAFIISRFKRKKGIISVFFLISRLFALSLAVVPFLPIGARAMAFVLIYSSMNFPDAISQTGLQGFLGDIFDGFTRSKAITLRNKLGQIITPVVTLSTGLIVMLVPKTNEQVVVVYQIFFVTAFLFGLLEIFNFLKFNEKPHDEESKKDKPGLKAITAALKDKQFVRYMIPTIFFYFMWQAGWPLFSILQVVDLGSNEFQMGINAAVTGVFGFLGANFWSKRISKMGNDLATVLAVFILALSMFLTSLSPNIWIYILNQTLGGFVGIGVTITMLNGLLFATPDKNRFIYIAVFNTFVNISLGISPLFANLLYDALGTRPAMYVISFGRALSGAVIYVIYRLNKRKKP